ncbi:hypothetical protein [uncultured Sphingomonas sp.]|uniref:hypothetical protein n=1 Tax=uncultured Sphingomonas sp. TaxID=158754 RepID=UPI0025E3681D|nr:hypothetical protein [uncultured Sphingomonas sp.]
MRTVTALLAMALAAPAMAQTAPAESISAEDRAALDRTAERGRLLAAYDRVAWLGTDDVQKRLPDWRQKLGGWIVEGPAAAPTLIFHDRSQPPRALYTGRLIGGKLTDATLITGDAAILSPAQLNLIAARDSAARAIGAARLLPCGPAFNTVVVPPAAPGRVTSVYFLSAQTKADDLPIGGHYRVDVAADGRAGAPYAFSKGCMTLPPPPKGQRGVGAVVSTLTAPLPNEAHSFVVEAYQRRLYVIVPQGGNRMFALTPGVPTRLVPTDTAKPGKAPKPAT